MPLRDYLLTNENIKFQSHCRVRYGERLYRIVVTDLRIILFAQRGTFLKSDDVVTEPIDKLNGVEYFEKGFIFRNAKLSIQGTTKLDLFGPTADLKVLFNTLQSVLAT